MKNKRYVKSISTLLVIVLVLILSSLSINTYADEVPVGSIIMWSGAISTIPSGWQLCDGTNGTPNLKDRFVVGAGSSYVVGATGGSSQQSIAAHTHNVTTSAHTHSVTVPDHTHSFNASGTTDNETGSDFAGSSGVYYVVGKDGHTHSFSINGTTNSASGTSGNTGSAGTQTITSTSNGAQTISTLPPYYALAYIMKTTASSSGSSNMSPALKVVQNVSFIIVVDGQVTSPDNGVTATYDSTNGYTTLTGTFSTTGTKVVTAGTKRILFTVIAKPTTTTIATLTFGS